MKKKQKYKLIFLLVFVLFLILLLFYVFFILSEKNLDFLKVKDSLQEQASDNVTSESTENRNNLARNPEPDLSTSNTTSNTASNTASNTTSNAYNEEETEKEQNMPINPDRVTLRNGFFYEPLSDDIINRITGISYKENPNITYDDLRYLNVQYWDFDQKKQTGEIICNKLIAEDLLEIFSELYDNFYQIEKIKLIDDYNGDDDLSCDDNNTSSFNYRVVAGTDHLSKHALGLAIDINPFYNPYITYPNGKERISPVGSEPYADRESGLPHMILKDDIVYNLFIEHGFTWGGEWKSLKDYQHFQKEL